MSLVDRKFFCLTGTPPSVIYEDKPQSIGGGQTISAPHMHAECLEFLEGHLKEGARVLDVGSGSGYLSACLALMAGQEGKGFLLGVEKVETLAERSVISIKKSIPQLGALPAAAPAQQVGGAAQQVGGAAVRPLPREELAGGARLVGSGINWEIWHGNILATILKDEAPFDAIHVGAAAEELPSELVDALAKGGRMVIPVGARWGPQVLKVVDKDREGKVSVQDAMSVIYVPLTRPTEMEDGYD